MHACMHLYLSLSLSIYIYMYVYIYIRIYIYIYIFPFLTPVGMCLNFLGQGGTSPSCEVRL